MLARPEQDAIDRLTKVAKRSKRSTVQLPQAFARDVSSKNPVPVLAALLQQNGLLIKVYLTLVMIATSAPHTTTISAAELATVLGLSKPTTAGARRVNRALKELETLELIRREKRPGRVPVTQILDARADGKDWDNGNLGKPWITVPIELWTRGWFIALPARALALIVVLRELTHGRVDQKGWVDGIRKRQYGLSDDTWARGIGELVDAGLLEVDRKTFSSQGEPRQRNVYRLRLERLAVMDPGSVWQLGK